MVLLDLTDFYYEYKKIIFINTYSGQELDDVAKASCELFDPKTNVSIAKYKLTSSHQLDKHTALVMGCIYRDSSTNEWILRYNWLMCLSC